MTNELDLLSKTEKVTLALLGLDDKPIKGKVWFQKELFLISKLDSEIQDEIEFEPHHYGPYSYDADYKLQNLESEDLIEIIGNEIYLTKKSEVLIALIIKSMPKEELEFLKRIKNSLNDLSMMELLAFIYQTNKDMTTQSVQLQSVLKNKVTYAISLFRKNKVSLGKASEIAEMSPKQFLQDLKKKGIQVETGV